MKFSIDRSFQTLMQQWEKQPRLAWSLSVAWVAILCILAFLWNLGSTGLIDETEPLFAEAARQMLVTGDWVTPYFNEVNRFDKPPLVYWLMAIAYQLVGVNAWGARLPSAIAAIALTGFGFVTLRYFGFPSPAAASSLADGEAPSDSPRPLNIQLWLAAWIGAALIALNPQTIVWARTGVSDMLLSGCMGCALLAFFWGYASPPNSRAQHAWYIAWYVLMALAVLAKGPVGVVLPVLIIAAFLLYVGQLRAVLREIALLRGALIFLAIAVPWYILVIQANGEAYIDSFFGYHNFQRFTSVVNRHSAPWYFYFLIVMGGFAPYSLHLPMAIARLRFWQRRSWQHQPRTAQFSIFALAWFLVIFVFFTIAVTKLPSYTLPLLPAAAILVALLWSDLLTQPHPGWGIKVSHGLNIVLMLVLGIAVYISPQILGNDIATPELPSALQASGSTLWGGVIWAIAALVGTLLLIQRQGKWLWGVNVVAVGAFVIVSVMPALTVVDAQRQLPLRNLAATIVQQHQPKEPLIMVGFQKPSLVFYAQRPIDFISRSQRARTRLRRRSDAGRRGTVMVIGLQNRIEDLMLAPQDYQLLDSQGEYRLIRVTMPIPSRVATQQAEG